MVVVAVDLGTTHSGYAFSFSRDPASVYVMSRWAGQEPGLLNHKTLSALLLTPDGRFHSFGLAARNHYHNLLPIEARLWLYFERFKMTLHHCKVGLFVGFLSPGRCFGWSFSAALLTHFVPAPSLVRCRSSIL
jgi:hypothetical protein